MAVETAEGFEDYDESTADPSPWVLIGVLALYMVSILLFPWILACRQWLRRRIAVPETAAGSTSRTRISGRSRHSDSSSSEGTNIELFYKQSAAPTVSRGLRTANRSRLLMSIVTAPTMMLCRPEQGGDDDYFEMTTIKVESSDDKNISIRSLDSEEKSQSSTKSFFEGVFPKFLSNLRQDSQASLSPSARIACSQKYGIDMLHGSRPWYCYYFSTGFFRKVRKCAAFDGEMKRLLRLAIPFTISMTIVEVFCLMEIVVVSQVLGTQSLSAFYAVEFIMTLSTMLMEGGMSSLTLLCSQAVGARNLVLAGKYVQLAIMFRILLFVPFAVYWWFNVDAVVMWLGFSEETALIAHHFSRFAFLIEVVRAFSEGLEYMLEVSGYERYSAILNTVGAVASFAAVLTFALVHPAPQLWMIGAVQGCTMAAVLVVNLIIVRCNGWIRKFWTGFAFRFALCDWRAVKTFFKAALPMAFGYATEYCEWEILFIFAAALGPAEVAVWGLIGSVWEIAENIGLSVADAAEVRVGQLLGSNRPALARYTSHKALFLGVLSSCFMALALFGISPFLPSWLTRDETLGRLLRELLPLVSAGVAALQFGTMSWTILCAQGRVLLATTTCFCGTLFFTVPLAVLSTFVLRWNLQGLVASVVVGYVFSGLINSFYMVDSNWDMIAQRIRKVRYLLT